MIDSIANFFGVVITYIYQFIPNFGAAIVIFSVLFKVITFPLNQKQLQSSKRMQELNPEIKRLQEKYKHDKEKQNAKMMEFMQKNKVNPMAGCLPMLVQLPILYGIFRLLRDTESFLGESINTFLIPSLSFIDLSLAPSAFQGDMIQQVIFYALPILSGLTTFLYQKIAITDPSQKMMLYMMPIMFVVISFGFPAGLIIYWITNNLLTMGQHQLIVKQGESEPKIEPEPVRGKKGKPTKAKKGAKGER
ncbi:MAG: YidC/Oxa1 family membrane protein insertase [Firmicutes bacterium]|nr:YidC/Oxa1 family membrane protein insertase [Bacillota bacterium]